MVDVTLKALAAQRRLTRVSVRAQLRWGSAAADVAAMVGAYMVALAVRNFAVSTFGLPTIPSAPDWSVAILTAAAVSAFYVSGLYELEAYASRPLHLWTLLKASLAALAISASSVYAIKSQAFDQPRLVLFITFVTFMVFACVLRLTVLDSLYVAWVRNRRPVSFLLGDSSAVGMLADRLSDMRGFDRVERVVPAAMALGMAEALQTTLEGRPSVDDRAASVFIDAVSATPREVFAAVAAAQARGADVYVVSQLLEALECNRLLSTLFGAPAVRVRGSIESAKPYLLKRAFDIVGSAVLLVICAPIIAVLGVVVRLTSRGPIFYRQTRVGRHGAPFEFLKLRSMVINHDASIHSAYVRAFMRGTAQAVALGPDGAAVYKRVDDPRITPVGAFIRKYSLDEVPQFWNVLCGDMSLVGPRPPLPYEVSEYDDWDSLRLNVPLGVTGLWQVEGRSRVSFDDMILQDVMYAENMRLLLDVKLCLMTIPAMLLGHGGG